MSSKASTEIHLDGTAYPDGRFQIEASWCEHRSRGMVRVSRVVFGEGVVDALGRSLALVVAHGGMLHTPTPRLFVIGCDRNNKAALEPKKET